jgi:Uma2 family endonuclease
MVLMAEPEAIGRVEDGVLIRSGYWTAERALRELPTTTSMTIEVIDGSLVVSPRPESRHQDVEHNLHELLRRAARRAGLISHVEINLKVGDNLFAPDIAVVHGHDDSRVWFGPEDLRLVVEIESPTGRRKDRFVRPSDYAAGKIPYYLRVEFRGDEPVLHLYELVDGEYQSVTSAGPGTRFVMSEPFAIELDPADLLDS